MKGDEDLRMGPCELTIDKERARVFAEDREVELSFQEYRLLLLLASRSPEAVPNAEIIAELWKGTCGRTVVWTMISRLRRKIGRGTIECSPDGYRINDGEVHCG